MLSGAQENPPAATGGRGVASVTVQPGGAAMTFTLEVSALSNITAAPIHSGAPGVNGPILFTLSPGPFASPLFGTPTASDFDASAGMTFAEAARAIREGRTYVNVHTEQHPDGEIRGHLGPASFRAALSGSEEVSPASTTATGLATAPLSSPVSGTLTAAPPRAPAGPGDQFLRGRRQRDPERRRLRERVLGGEPRGRDPGSAPAEVSREPPAAPLSRAP